MLHISSSLPQKSTKQLDLTFIHSPTHPLTHSPTHLLTYSPTHLLTHSPTHPLTHSPTHSLTHSPTHPLTHSPTHPLTHSPTHPLGIPFHSRHVTSCSNERSQQPSPSALARLVCTNASTTTAAAEACSQLLYVARPDDLREIYTHTLALETRTGRRRDA
jgi:hypothetical protein